ncbi:MAG: plastocyanin/azurin family copper-binding protein [Nitrososphaerales archaeon]
MKSKPFGAIFGLLALVAILGVAPAFGQGVTSDVTIVSGAGASASAACVTTNNCFSPSPLGVAPGTTVTWTNTDTVSHTITSGKMSDNDSGSMFDSGLVKPTKTFQFTFANAGTFNYFCTVHPWMVGQVIVGAAAGVTAPGNQAGIPLGPPYTAPTNTTASMQPMSNMTMGQNATAPGNQAGIPLGPPYTAGNATVPEFGPVASIVLAIAVLSVVVFAAKTRVIPRL